MGTVAGGVGGGGVVEADADLRGWTVAGVGTASVGAFIVALGVGTTGRGRDGCGANGVGLSVEWFGRTFMEADTEGDGRLERVASARPREGDTKESTLLVAPPRTSTW